MKEQKGFHEEEINEERHRRELIAIVFVIALLIGFLAGLLSHDHLLNFSPDHAFWKSWYPR